MIRRVDAAEVIQKSKTLESVTMLGLRRPPKSTFAVQVTANDNLCHMGWVEIAFYFHQLLSWVSIGGLQIDIIRNDSFCMVIAATATSLDINCKTGLGLKSFGHQISLLLHNNLVVCHRWQNTKNLGWKSCLVCSSRALGGGRSEVFWVRVCWGT